VTVSDMAMLPFMPLQPTMSISDCLHPALGLSHHSSQSSSCCLVFSLKTPSEPIPFMTALFESFLQTIICDVFSVLIPTYLSLVGSEKPILDKVIQ